MALRMSDYIKPQDISVLVHFPGDLSKMESTSKSGYVLNRFFEEKKTVCEYLMQKIKFEEISKIRQALSFVKLDSEVLKCFLNELTIVEAQKVQLASLFLMQSQILVVEHFFCHLIYGEQQYFKKLFRNLTQKKKKSIILIEDDMNFICEFVKKVILFTKGECSKEIDNFYAEELYKYVEKPKTVELVQYLEQKGHQIDHEITFNETLKAIYRGVS